MKEYRLSTRAERIASITFVAALIACFGLLIYALRVRPMLMLLCGLAVFAISALLAIYVVSVLKAACVINAEEKTMEVRGLSNYTVDLSNAVLLQTIARKGVQTTLRALMFSDAEENVIVVVPTMFTFKQGIYAEPMAKEMAQYLGIDFQQNVPEWEYDKEKYKEHEKEVAQQQKRDARQRRQKRMERRIRKYKENK